MGYTNETFGRIIPILQQNQIKNVLDLGAQNDYTQPVLPAPYTKDWYLAHGCNYTAIDISGENGSFPFDLGQPVDDTLMGAFDLIVDAGTSEHVGRDGKHHPEAIYNCFKNKHDMCAVVGFMVAENPKTGNWPGHGFNYFTKSFYMRLATKCGYKMLDLGEHAAMGNITDGWNVHCILQRVTAEPFISLERFNECGIELN